MATIPPISHETPEPVPLCLKCRLPSHFVSACGVPFSPQEMSWFMPAGRKFFDIGKGADGTQSDLCKRCRDLDILRMLKEDIPWGSRAQLNEDQSDDGSSLSGRNIDPNGIDVDMVQKWLSSCKTLHPLTCSPYWTEELQDIRLIRVKGREIIKYPSRSCQYLALSYVWGDTIQGGFKLGQKLPVNLSRMIEDAMLFVKRLGREFLWVDSICIDQKDENDKRHQLKRMGDIYRGAYATIIALSGPSASWGLLRIGPNRQMYPQLSCIIGGKRLVGVMPTLSNLLWIAPCAKRAWTFQESLLSRRCIYISDFQVYFECNAMQCCETLDDERSWIHQLPRDRTFPGSDVGHGCLRHSFEHDPEPMITRYASRLVLYCYRSMTDPNDAVNAFSGILQDLEKKRMVQSSLLAFR
jgi:hypothetical protein